MRHSDLAGYHLAKPCNVARLLTLVGGIFETTQIAGETAAIGSGLDHLKSGRIASSDAHFAHQRSYCS